MRDRFEMDELDKYLKILPTIDGWFSQEAATIWWTLLDQQEALGVRGNMLELGVWRGKSALLLLLRERRTSQERCVLVDIEMRMADLEYQLARVGHTLPSSTWLLERSARNLLNTSPLDG